MSYSLDKVDVTFFAGINSLTAMDGHDRPLITKLHW
jgi:hypothetical protein